MESEELLKKHLGDRFYKNMTLKIPNYKELIINALDEAINYTHSCEKLKENEAPTFEEWIERLFDKRDDKTYWFKGSKTDYLHIDTVMEAYESKYL